MKLEEKIFELVIKPKSQDKDSQRQEYILNVLLTGVLAVATIALFVAAATYLVPPHNNRLENGLITLVFWISTFVLVVVSRLGHWKVTAWIFVLFLSLSAAFFCLRWGFGLAVAQLLFCATIVMAGVLLSARTALIFSGGISATVMGLAVLEGHGVIHPRSNWRLLPDSFDDAIAFAVIFSVIGLVAWLWNRETDASLKRARASEAELQKERDNLELTVAQRTHELKELQASRLLEMQPLAELGRIGASLIHDMSSPLTAASLQLELLGKTKQSRSLKVVHQNVDVLGKYLVAARKQLQHASEESYFDVPQELKQVINLLRYRARTTGVTLHVGRLAAAQLYGDPVKFHKIVANLIANALDASESAPHKDVFVRLRPQAKNLELSVKDYGVGIPESLLPHLFEPFYSTKKLSDVRGLGIGLAMVKQYVEQDFGGQIVVSSSAKEGTIFKLLFPLHGVKK